MKSSWVKSLQCKSKAFDDVQHPNPTPIPNPKYLLSSASCRKTAKDVIEAATAGNNCSSQPRRGRPKNVRPETSNAERNITRYRTHRNPESVFPALAELPEGHPSRNVVEIIFHTSWSPNVFTGRIDFIFKFQNGSRTVSRFEEYREIIKARAVADRLEDGESTWEENARCIADGNEVMQFVCLGLVGSSHDACCGAWTVLGGKASTICTFSGSGWAHHSVVGGRGRRAMLVCRVIAGRVSSRVELDSFSNGRVRFDSVSGDNGELVVFDSRAILPCFVIIYKSF